MTFKKINTLEQQKKVAMLTLWVVGGGIGVFFMLYLINLNFNDKNKYNQMGSYKLRNLSDAFVFVNIDNKHLLTKFISFEYEGEVAEVATVAKTKTKQTTEPTQVETVTRIVTTPPAVLVKPVIKPAPKKLVEDDGGFSIKPVPKK